MPRHFAFWICSLNIPFWSMVSPPCCVPFGQREMTFETLFASVDNKALPDWN